MYKVTILINQFIDSLSDGQTLLLAEVLKAGPEHAEYLIERLAFRICELKYSKADTKYPN
jgi:hypothetical protein